MHWVVSTSNEWSPTTVQTHAEHSTVKEARVIKTEQFQHSRQYWKFNQSWFWLWLIPNNKGEIKIIVHTYFNNADTMRCNSVIGQCLHAIGF